MDQTSNEYLSAHGKQIGRVVIAAAILDDAIADLASECLQLTRIQENALLRPMQTRAKAELIVRIGKLFLKGDSLKPLTKWCQSVKGKLDDRNSLIHGSPGHIDGKVHFRSFGGKNRMLGEPEPWPVEKVSELADTFMRLVDQLDEVRPLFDAWIAVAQAELSSRRPAPETPPEE